MKPSDIIQQFGLETSTDENDFLIASDRAEECGLKALAQMLRTQFSWLSSRRGRGDLGYGMSGYDRPGGTVVRVADDSGFQLVMDDEQEQDPPYDGPDLTLPIPPPTDQPTDRLDGRHLFELYEPPIDEEDEDEVEYECVLIEMPLPRNRDRQEMIGYGVGDGQGLGQSTSHGPMGHLDDPIGGPGYGVTGVGGEGTGAGLAYGSDQTLVRGHGHGQGYGTSHTLGNGQGIDYELWNTVFTSD